MTFKMFNKTRNKFLLLFYTCTSCIRFVTFVKFSFCSFPMTLLENTVKLQKHLIKYIHFMYRKRLKYPSVTKLYLMQ